MKPSTYFKQRIIVYRTVKNLSYEKKRNAFLIENFKISNKNIGKICRNFKNELRIIDKKRTRRNFMLFKNIMDFIDELIESDRSIKVAIIKHKVNNMVSFGQ